MVMDARERADMPPKLRNATRIPQAEASKAKDDGRLPMTDHNTRTFVVGDGAAQARRAAGAIVQAAFGNVAFCPVCHFSVSSTWTTDCVSCIAIVSVVYAKCHASGRQDGNAVETRRR
jgi:hypothetical protein